MTGFHNKEEQGKAEVWCNSNDLIVHEGRARVLSDHFLAVCLDGCWGVIDQDGKRIVNYQYDWIEIIGNKLIVAKDGKVGVLDENGCVLINPTYKSIENVSIQDGMGFSWPSRNKEGQNSKECIFDTSVEKCPLVRKIILANGETNFYHKFSPITIKGNKESYNFDNLFVLTADGYCELFSIKDGVIPQSRYDEIRLLKNNAFAVREGNKWGVLCAVSKGYLAISCDYSRILYCGGSVALLCKNGLWGAQSFALNVFFGIVNVPLEYLEIEILDEKRWLFGVKRSHKGYNGEIKEDYTIVDKKGVVLGNMITGLESPCRFYNENRILSSHRGKYGFVSTKGHVSIPFKYDLIEERADGLFNVKNNLQIEDGWGGQISIEAWGVLAISGKEVVCVKYREKIPPKWAGTKVCDVQTGRWGILAEDGTELIPSIFEHLMIKEVYGNTYIYFGFGGRDNSKKRGDCVYNFFSGNIEGADWGCMDNTGRILVEAGYDCIKHYCDYILAGRDGRMLGEGQRDYSYRETEYGGVYDLYSEEGVLLFGGFNEFECEDDLYMFHFGGEWKEDCEEYDDYWNYIGYYSYHFDDEGGRWLITDKQLKSIIKGKNGERVQFRTGYKEVLKSKENEDDIVHYWNVPVELLSKKRPEMKHGLVVCSHDKGVFIVRIEDGFQTDYYHSAQIISNERFFFADIIDGDVFVGIADIVRNEAGESKCKIVIEAVNHGFRLLTCPVDGFVFGVLETGTNQCVVKLYDIKAPQNEPITAISSCTLWDVLDIVKQGLLRISIEKEAEGLKQITVQDLEIFDESFRKLISEKERVIPVGNDNEKYWFTVYYMRDYDECDEHERNYDDYDYRRDSRDSMTDGQYGDMPDGFDGDYDFMG